jgi:hypothetical protein
MRLLDYFKYVLLLKGNYECSPAAMDVLIDEACTLEGSTLTVGGWGVGWVGWGGGLNRADGVGRGGHV